MARRSPRQVREEQPRRPVPVPPIPRSPRGRACLARLESTRLHPGDAVRALRAWELHLRDPIHRLWDESAGCGVWECCPVPAEVRWILGAVAAALPPRDARAFRARVAELDELW